jgi:hypothetical protein
MAISCSLVVEPSAPGHGETVTARYIVSGNDGTPPSGATVSGGIVVAGSEYDVSTTITLPGSPAPEVSYHIPLCEGLTFAVTDDPAVFTAKVP